VTWVSFLIASFRCSIRSPLWLGPATSSSQAFPQRRMSTYDGTGSNIIISCLNYGNSVLTGLPVSTLQPLTKVLYTAARLVKDLCPRDHITQPLIQLHWLEIGARISFKINLLRFNIYSGSSPVYMSSLVTISSQSNSSKTFVQLPRVTLLYRAPTFNSETVVFTSLDLRNGIVYPESLRRSRT